MILRSGAFQSILTLIDEVLSSLLNHNPKEDVDWSCSSVHENTFVNDIALRPSTVQKLIQRGLMVGFGFSFELVGRQVHGLLWRFGL